METAGMGQFKDLFLMEVEDHIQRLNDNILELEQVVSAPENNHDKIRLLNEMMRSSHTIKGSSASMGYEKLAYLTHVLEDIFDGARNGALSITKPIIDKIFFAVDAIEKSVKAIKNSNLENDTDSLAQELKNLAGVKTSGIGKSLHKTDSDAEPNGSALIEKEINEVALMNYIKVPVNRLELLMGLVEELHINKMSLEVLANAHKEIKDVSHRISLLVAGIQYHIMQARMVPLEQVFARFPRMVRDLAQSQGKKIKFEIIGHEIELDRTIIDKIGEPLIHLLRNAIDHGIAKEGKIILLAVREGDRIKFSVENDGQSIDFARVRESAVKKNIISSEEAADYNEDRLKELLFKTGLSTRETVTDISGRGVGLSVVKNFVDSLNGRLLIENLQSGVRFTMVLPLSMAIVNVLLVMIKGNKYAIPFVNIERLARVGRNNINAINGREVAEVGGEQVSLIASGEILNSNVAVEAGTLILKNKQAVKSKPGIKKTNQGADEQKNTIVVIIKNEKYCLGLVVDELINVQEVIVKPLSPILQGLKSFSGSTILGDGHVVPILDVGRLLPAI